MAKTHKIGIQADHFRGWKPDADSTLELTRAALARGYEAYYYHPSQLSLQNAQAVAPLQQLLWKDGLHAGELSAEPQPLSSMDAILIRQDPPYNMGYLTPTYMLETLGEQTRVINAPAALRDYPEKLIPLHFPEHTPATLVSSDTQALKAFQQQHGEVIVKPLFGFGGNDVFHIPASGDNLSALLEHWLTRHPEPLVIQRFLPDVRSNEIRVITLGNIVAGAFRRRPAAGEIRTNMRVGGTAELVELSDSQQQLCQKIASWCNQRGILLSGIDLIGDMLIEVNTTSPTGLATLRLLGAGDIAANFWDMVNLQGNA